MTQEQKKQITEMRKQNLGYAYIAKRTGLIPQYGQGILPEKRPYRESFQHWYTNRKYS